jgi:amidohydrolase/hippurate hydrolase
MSIRWCGFSAGASGKWRDSMNRQFEIKAAAGAYARAVRHRRHIHAYPELSGREYATAQHVFKRLLRLGLAPRRYVRGAGVAASLTYGKGPVVVVRADLDALPIQEENRVPFRSRVPGVMHACGHDVHTAVLLGVAEILCRWKQRLRGTVVFLFQPAEERSPGGARAMISQGAFPGRVDAVFGLHVNPEYPTGSVAVASGCDYAGVSDFDLIVKGRGGHGATPKTAIDPISCAARIIVRLEALTKGKRSELVSIGSVHAGTQYNIIPDTAHIAGTVRAFSSAAMARLIRRIRKISTSTCRSFGARARLSVIKGYPPLCNNPVLAAHAHRILSRVLGARNVVRRTRPAMYAEDFAYYALKAPAVFLHLGVRPRGKRTAPGIHTARFLPDEKAMMTGMTALASLVAGMMADP